MGDQPVKRKQPVWINAMVALVPVLLAVLGYGGFEYKAMSDKVAATETTVNVTVEGIDAPVHAHGAVLSRDSVKAVIAAAIADQHKADLIIFKQKEPWE